MQLRLEELKPVQMYGLTVNVLVYPGIAQYDNRFDVLAAYADEVNNNINKGRVCPFR